jgi:PAS domain S-box-containing protein
MLNSFATFDDINAIILVANKEGMIVFANKAVKTILGYEPEEVLGDGWWRLTAHDSELEERKIKTSALVKGELELKERHLFENSLKAKDNRLVWTRWTNTITEDGFLVGIAQDITEKKKLEKELIRKNTENELLLKEIHHRVKNNMQIISSFLNLQFCDFEDEKVKDALLKSKDRINSMALIHTKIYQSKDLDSINFCEYIQNLTKVIKEGYSLNKNIEIKITDSNSVFEIDLMINLGLIITEIVTNAFKHAFNELKEGMITIELQKNQNENQLFISDNGIGFNFSRFGKNTLGLEIIRALVQQINGTIEIDSQNGLKYTIRF